MEETGRAGRAGEPVSATASLRSDIEMDDCSISRDGLRTMPCGRA